MSSKINVYSLYNKNQLLNGFLIEYPGKPVNISLTEHGDLAVVDVTIGDVSNQDSHLWKSPVCTTMAHVDSLI